jgi:hypothetical protein
MVFAAIVLANGTPVAIPHERIAPCSLTNWRPTMKRFFHLAPNFKLDDRHCAFMLMIAGVVALAVLLVAATLLAH